MKTRLQKSDSLPSLDQLHDHLLEKGWEPERNQHGNHITFRIVSRGDRTPSGRAALSADGELLVWDETNKCSPREIYNALGYKPPSYLWPASHDPASLLKEGYKREAEYRYEDGPAVLRRVLKYRRTDGSKKIVQQRPVGGRWESTVENVPNTLYAVNRLRCTDKMNPVFIVEGEKDADTIISKCHTATCGPGGAGKWPKVLEYAQKELKDRHVVVIADNDKAGTKHAVEVAESMLEIAASVKVIWALPDVGPKGDVSDWFAQGHSIDELLALVEQTPEFGGQPQYERREDGLYHIFFDGKGQSHEVHLTNFTAQIVAVQKRIFQDVEPEEEFLLRCQLGDKVSTVAVTLDEFTKGDWFIRVHPKATLRVVSRAKEHLRNAVQETSPHSQIENHIVFQSMGWFEGMYVHSGGAIACEGNIADAKIDLPAQFAPYNFAGVGEDALACISATLRSLNSAPPEITYPLFGAVYRSVLGGARLSIHLCGSTGTRKTSLGQLFLGHFGAGHTEENVAWNFDGTTNAIIGACATVGQAAILIDELVPRGSRYEQQKLVSKVETLRSAVGNMGGRQRMTSTARLMQQPSLDCVLITTGEDEVGRESSRARTVTLPFDQSTVRLDKLTESQADRASGLLAGAMARYIQWLAPQIDVKRKWARARAEELRDGIDLEGHPRNRANWAQLVVGWELFLQFAAEIGNLTDAVAAQYVADARAAICKAIGEHAQEAEDNRPVPMFFSAVRDAMLAGYGHFRDVSGRQPDLPDEVTGWREDTQGEQIGWIAGDQLWLLPRASHTVASRANPELISQNALARALNGDGKLLESGKRTLAVRKKAGGQWTRVWVLRLSDVFELTGEPPEETPF